MKILKLYRTLKAKQSESFRRIRQAHRKQTQNELQRQWSLWCKRPKTTREKEQVIIEAILTQRTNWRNVRLAFAKLTAANANSLETLMRLGKRDRKKLEELIRASGFYRAKAQYLMGLAKFFLDYGGIKNATRTPLKKMREQLFALPGVGEETADSILLYALEKPIFVIDEYTRRLVKKEGITANRSYSYLQHLFEAGLQTAFPTIPQSNRETSLVPLYQDFHALIVIWGKDQ